jgi:hypothetical protein
MPVSPDTLGMMAATIYAALVANRPSTASIFSDPETSDRIRKKLRLLAATDAAHLVQTLDAIEPLT